MKRFLNISRPFGIDWLFWILDGAVAIWLAILAVNLKGNFWGLMCLVVAFSYIVTKMVNSYVEHERAISLHIKNKLGEIK